MTVEQLTKSKYLKKAHQLRSLGLYPFFRKIQSTDGSNVVVDNKQQVMIGSNNYLGLTHHPYVIEAAKKSLEKYGTGCTGSRFLNGNLEIHEQLEESLAKYTGKEKALVFSTGMQVNLGCLSALSGPKDVIYSDGENHASIIDGTRLAYGTTFKYKHNNMQELEELLLTNKGKYKNILIASDGVFSMTGDLMKVPETVALAKKHNALIYLDDAHGIGVMGELGRGTASYFNCTEDVDLIMGTFSKSFASIGGFVAGSSELIDYLKHAARSFMFSAAMPPSAVATVQASLELILAPGSQIHNNLWDNVAFMKKGLNDLGFFTYDSETPIIPILVGDDLKSMQITKFLEENGVFATPVIQPAVPEGEALIRTSYMSTHRKEDLEYCLEVFAKVKKTFDIPSTEKTQ